MDHRNEKLGASSLRTLGNILATFKKSVNPCSRSYLERHNISNCKVSVKKWGLGWLLYILELWVM